MYREDKRLSELTDREKEVVMELLKGKSNAAMADDLDISLNTVKTHLKHVFSKLEVKSRQELIVEMLMTPPKGPE